MAAPYLGGCHQIGPTGGYVPIYQAFAHGQNTPGGHRGHENSGNVNPTRTAPGISLVHLTHAGIPKEERKKSGVVDALIRLRAGIGVSEDVMECLCQAME